MTRRLMPPKRCADAGAHDDRYRQPVSVDVERPKNERRTTCL
jgi:hypothetical protein